jgi:hypothetical protein
MDSAVFVANGLVVLKVIGLVIVGLFGAQIWVLLDNLAGSIKDSRWRAIAITVVHAIQQQYETLTGSEKAEKADAILAKVLKGSTADERRTLLEASVLVMKAAGTKAPALAAEVAAAKAKADEALSNVQGLAKAITGATR